MQSLTDTLTSRMVAEAPQKKSFDWQLVFSIGALIVCGSFTYTIYPPPVNAAALGLVMGIYYYSLHKQDLISFFIQLFIGNFFIFGNKFGGNYNLAAFAAIVFYTAINGKIAFLRNSIFDRSIKTALFIWCMFAFLSITGGNMFPFSIELQNFFAFCILLFSFYLVSRIEFTENDIYKFIVTVSIFAGYEFFLALNQKYLLFNSPFPFFPNTNEAIDFDMGVVRSFSTLNNFEAFAEFSASLIMLLLPGVLSGSFIKKSKPFYYLSITAMLLSCLSIVFSGTRSSMLLLPFAIVTICIMLGRRLKASIVISVIAGSLILFAINTQYKLVDFSVFAERSEGMDMDHMSVGMMVSGEGMNRGGLFPYAFQQMKKTGIIGRGYFVSADEYHAVQFEKGAVSEGIADYHNLYMSTYVMFGAIGFLAMMFLFFYSLIKGWQTYWQLRKEKHFLIDLLLGFNVLFFYLMINQFKIQFIREINYFTVIMLLLALYISLTWMLRQDAFIKKSDERKHLAS